MSLLIKEAHEIDYNGNAFLCRLLLFLFLYPAIKIIFFRLFGFPVLTSNDDQLREGIGPVCIAHFRVVLIDGFLQRSITGETNYSSVASRGQMDLTVSFVEVEGVNRERTHSGVGCCVADANLIEAGMDNDCINGMDRRVFRPEPAAMVIYEAFAEKLVNDGRNVGIDSHDMTLLRVDTRSRAICTF